VRTDVTFPSAGLNLAGYLYTPDGQGESEGEPHGLEDPARASGPKRSAKPRQRK
jgi:hypothetical protein